MLSCNLRLDRPISTMTLNVIFKKPIVALQLENTALLEIGSFRPYSSLARCPLRKRAKCFQQVRLRVPLEHEGQDVNAQPWIVMVVCQVL